MYIGLPILKYFLHLMSYPAGFGETKKENYILKFNFPGFGWYLTKKTSCMQVKVQQSKQKFFDRIFLGQDSFSLKNFFLKFLLLSH